MDFLAARALTTLNSRPYGQHDHHTNWAHQAMLPVTVIMGEFDVFSLEDNITYIFPNSSESSHRLKMLAISPSKTPWQPNQGQGGYDPLVIVSPGP